MSLAIVTTTNEGNILAADSLETYTNSKGDTREGSQTRMKLFQLNSRVGGVACGLSFLDNKNIYQHILRFKKQYRLENKLVEQIADSLHEYFGAVYQAYIAGMAKKREEEFKAKGCENIKQEIDLECILFKYKDTQGTQTEKKFCMPILEFLIVGHDPDGTNHVFKVIVPDPKDKNGIVEKLSKEQCGATWIGQTDVLVRIIRGWSPEIKRLKVISEIPDKRRAELLKQLDDQEYLINWGTMTIQDAVEFSNLAIKTTESIQKITDGTWASPGSSPGVGGEVDIAVITPKKGFAWVQKKKISINGTEMDLDELPDLPIVKSTGSESKNE